MSIRERSGFILVYVAVMVAAMALILFGISRMRSPSPLFVEKQIAGALHGREEELLLDFVTGGLEDRKLAADPRYLQFRNIAGAGGNMPSEMEEQLAWLKAALAQLNFNIQVPGGGNAGTNATEGSAAQSQEHEGQGALFRPQKDAYVLKLGDTEYRITVLPGNALPNLNAVPYGGVWRYLVHLGLAENEARDLAAALVDWRDADDFLTDGRGAESNYYYGLSASYPARNGPIHTWQELNYVRGVNAERVALLREHFMLGQPGAQGLWPDASTPEVLAALSGLRLDTVTALLASYGRLGENPTLNERVLLAADIAAFDRVVAWQMDGTLLRIRIASAERTLTADYDAAKKRLRSWW